MRRMIFMLTVGILLSLTLAGWAGDTSSQDVQVLAKLTDVYGDPLPAGDYCLRFLIYRSLTDAEVLLSIEKDPVTVAEGGYINVILANVPGSVFDDGSTNDDGERYIQIMTCGDEFIGSRNPIIVAKSGVSATREASSAKSFRPCLIDTYGDTVCISTELLMSSASEVSQLKTLLGEIQEKIALLEKMNNYENVTVEGK